MRHRLHEHTILFGSVIKWFILATLIGSLTGVGVSLFIWTLNWSIAHIQIYPHYFVILPIAFFLSSFIEKNTFPKADVYTTNKVIEYIHRLKHIPPLSILKAFICPVITVASGGSTGKEAPAADIGAGIGSIIGKLFRLNEQEVRKLMICGVSAGFAAVFGTPVAGAIFGVEVLFVGSLLYDVLFPAFTAGIIGCQVSAALGVTYMHIPATASLPFDELYFVKVVAAGIFFGLCSFLFIEMMIGGKKLAAKIKWPAPLKGLLGGTILMVLAFLFSGLYLGLGLNTVEECLRGVQFPWYAFFMKMLFTVVTLTMGGAGGVITPILFVGATSGQLFAHWLGMDPVTFSILGIIGVLAGTMNTPIAASIMAIELFGPQIAPYAAIVSIVSFIMTGQRSMYPSQIMQIKKSSSIDIDKAK